MSEEGLAFSSLNLRCPGAKEVRRGFGSTNRYKFRNWLLDQPTRFYSLRRQDYRFAFGGLNDEFPW